MQTSRFNLFSRAFWGRAQGTPSVNLGLQGGGAHGAFTWGVLDVLLQDPRIDIEGISGTSAAPPLTSCCKYFMCPHLPVLSISSVCYNFSTATRNAKALACGYVVNAIEALLNKGCDASY